LVPFSTATPDYVNNLLFSTTPLSGWLLGGAVVRRFSWVFGTVVEESYRAANVFPTQWRKKE